MIPVITARVILHQSKKNIYCFNYFLLLLLITRIYGKPNTILKTIENCDPNVNYAVSYNVTFNVTENKQYASGHLTLKAPLDNDVSTNVTIDRLIGNKYIYLFAIREKRSCDALYKYFGEFSYELERNLGILVAACPVAKGRYYARNLPLNYEKVTTIHNFPSGILRFTVTSYDKHDNVYACIIIEIQKHA